LLFSSFVLYEIYLFNKADKDLTQLTPLHHLQIYLPAENGTVNKVLDSVADHHQPPTSAVRH